MPLMLSRGARVLTQPDEPAVLQEPQNQDRFQEVHQSCGDPVQELSGGVCLGSQ